MPIRRQLKNVVNNYTDSQVKVREATSNDPWGPSSSLMTEIADLTYNVVAFSEIMTMLWKRLNDHGKNWRHVYKSLVVLEYIIKTGSERVAQQCKENIFAIQTLKDFQFIDRDGKDQGVNVREKSKMLVSLLKDDERLKQERARALKAKERFAQASSGIGSNSEYDKQPTEFKTEGSPDNQNADQDSTFDSTATPPVNPGELEQARPQTTGEEELQLQLALAMSKEEAEEFDRQARSDDVRLQMALNESLDKEQAAAAAAAAAAAGAGGGGGLLDLTEPLPVGASTLPSADPWGAEPDVVPAVDPWGAAAAAPPPAQPDPWGGPALTQPVATASPPQPPHPAIVADTWGSPALVGQRSASPAVDIWGPPPVTGNVATGQTTVWGESSTDPDADFDSIRIAGGVGNNDPFGGPPAASAQPVDNMFDLGSMGMALSSNALDDKKKSASDFLGENSSLVNLDSLIGPTPQQQVAQPGSTNPFAVNTTSKSTNPFQVQHSASPTLNQMKQPPTMGMPMPIYASQLPQPMLPASNAPQQQQQSTNPFLF